MAEFTGTAGDDSIVGTSEADMFFLSTGDDTLRGDAGDDVFSVPSLQWNVTGGNTSVEGGDGSDMLRIPDYIEHVSVTRNSDDQVVITGEFQTITLLDSIERFNFNGDRFTRFDIEATRGDDLIVGTDGRDSFVYSLGNDTLIAGAGVDFLNATGGISAGTVVDLAAGTLVTSEFTQTISGFENFSTYRNSSATIRGDDGANSLEIIEGSSSLIEARGGDDDVFLFGTDSTVDGGSGDDTITAEGEGNHVYGGAGADLFEVEGDNSTLYGGAGDDRFVLSATSLRDESVVIEGGTGLDAVDLSFLSMADITVAQEVGQQTLSWTRAFTPETLDVQQIILLDTVESFVFSDGTRSYTELFDAPLLGTDMGEVITGTTGADALNALGGNDWITTGGGMDTIDGGAGIDTLSLADAFAQPGNGIRFSSMNLEEGFVQVTNPGPVGTVGNERSLISNIENLTGTSRADLIRGDAGANILRGLGGRDDFYLSAGGDLIDGGAGRDTVRVAQGDAQDSSISLLRGRIWEGGGEGTRLQSIESIISRHGNDMLTGSHANNHIRAGYGDDTLMGNGGDDRLYGGFGDDVALFSYAQDQYAITTAGEVTTVSYIGAGAGDGTDTLLQIETLRFADGDLVL